MTRWARRSALAVSVALGIGGLGMIAQGVAVPIKAEIAQDRLERAFEQRLASNEAGARRKHDARTTGPTPPLKGRGLMRPPAPHTTSIQAAGPIARLSIERLGVKEIVLAGNGSHEQLAQGPTMVKRSNASSAVTVLAAHRDTHFLFIRDLRKGDEVTLQFVTGAIERYRVTRFETVRWDEFTYPLDPARPLLALATCYPFGGTEYGGPWRRIAWAEKLG